MKRWELVPRSLQSVKAKLCRVSQMKNWHLIPVLRLFAAKEMIGGAEGQIGGKKGAMADKRTLAV